METKQVDQWLIRSIEQSLTRVQNSDFVNIERLGAITEPEFIHKVKSALQESKSKKAA